MYPKLSRHKTSKVHTSHYSAAEWVDRRKKKMIVLQELDDLDRTLGLTKADGTMDNGKWRTWNEDHKVSKAMWNVLLCQIPTTYFAKRLMNEAKLKRAFEFQEKFPEVLHILRNFLRLKMNFREAGGSGKFKTLDVESMDIHGLWTYQPDKRLLLALMDLRDTAVHCVSDDHKKQPFFHSLLSTLRTMKTPPMLKPTIWVWVVNSANRLSQAAEYTRHNFANYSIIESKYILAKNERLYDQSARKPSQDVYLLFLVQIEDSEAVRLKTKIRLEYRAPDIPYYVEAGKYQELKYRLYASELRMEFYLDLLFDLYRPRDRFLGVFIGSKYLVAAKVRSDTINSL
jgi:hypothetical protein